MIREFLKQKGATWVPEHKVSKAQYGVHNKVWAFPPGVSESRVRRWLENPMVEEDRGLTLREVRTDNNCSCFDDSQVSPILKEAKEIWSVRMERYGITSQELLLPERAGVYVRYIKEGEFSSRHHRIIPFTDPLLLPHARAVVTLLQNRGLDAYVTDGTDVDRP